jgi:TolB protein
LKTRLTWLALLLLVTSQAHAVLTIEIDRGYDNPKRIAVVPFTRGGALEGVDDVAEIIAFNLARTGQFSPLGRNNMLSLPSRPEEVFFRDWRVLGMEYLVIGSKERDRNGDLMVRFSLFDVLSERLVAGERLVAPMNASRDIAHLISDVIYEQLTGVRGAFSTRIAYVLAQNIGTREERFELQIADVDGARPRTLLTSGEPILSVSWSSDGRYLAYVSFEQRRPMIFMHEIATGERTVLADHVGSLNGAPAFSPDNRRVAMVLSRDGNPEIYVKELRTGELRRITRHPAIDTEPSWTPDGRSLVFTSDRGGRPQIYRVNIDTGLTERLTFVGDYNARPQMLPDGRHMVFVHRSNGVYQIGLQDLERDRVMVLTETDGNESPSVAPNGTMLIYATRDRGQGILAVVSIDGRVKYRLPAADGDVREPSWSPFLNRARVVN